MNYRHHYHAGNFADIMKHSVLVSLLQALSRKPKPWRYYDTHAGAGLYDTQAGMAAKTGEAGSGIGRLWHLKERLPEPVAGLCRIVAEFNPDASAERMPRYYPGSPMLAAALAREHDRLVFAEQHPEEAALLKQQFHRDRRGAVHERDGYEMVRALVPPPERRGLVLMDPPFERADEFNALVETCIAAHARWPDGVYALWYPVKEAAPVARFHRQLRESGMRRILLTELRVGPASAATLSASGMVVVNPPWQSEQAIAGALAFLARTLAPGAGGSDVSWLVPE
ncbi:MAG TPA: 23S rRNA (adenine(2030)-N(6))-methyltransferase RlmJ [Gammaproteobacteria bacterium]|nr:23S rRNA (adenine(2030)-N(6))-methyltransferase RlmJ [Gammaproteobacteria bacterium]